MLSDLDVANGALAWASGERLGYRGNFSQTGQAIASGQISMEDFYAEAAKNAITFGTYEEGLVGIQLYYGQITEDEASQRFAAAGFGQLMTAKMLSMAKAKAQAMAKAKAAAAALKDMPAKVYRGGANTADNLTPRPGIDTTGLSTFDNLEAATKPGGKAQVIDISRLKPPLVATPQTAFNGTCFNRPDKAALIAEWAAAQGQADHPLTQAIMDAIVEVAKGLNDERKQSGPWSLLSEAFQTIFSTVRPKLHLA